jgi:hypothetical protein
MNHMNPANPSAAIGLNLKILVAQKKLPIPTNYIFKRTCLEKLPSRVHSVDGWDGHLSIFVLNMQQR